MVRVSKDDDIRCTKEFRAIWDIYERIVRHGAERITDASDLSCTSSRVAFAGVIVERLEGEPQTRICTIDLAIGDIRVLSSGPNNDKSPKFSPSGSGLAFLSDRAAIGNHQLYLIKGDEPEVCVSAGVPGWVEYYCWCPDGKLILMGVVPHGSDTAGGQGGKKSATQDGDHPTWFPQIDSATSSSNARSLWCYDLATAATRRLGTGSDSAWEACWCGPDAIALIGSADPSEAGWYDSTLQVFDLATGVVSFLYAPDHQIACPTASPSGRWVAFVDCVASDRGLIAGTLKLVDLGANEVKTPLVNEIDVTYSEWASDTKLIVTGYRGLSTVVGALDVDSGAFLETWVGKDFSISGRCASAAPLNASGDIAFIVEGFKRSPAIVVVENGVERQVASFDAGYEIEAGAIADVRPVQWTGPQDWEVEGWLLVPVGDGPFPLVVAVHGGPVSLWRPSWLGRPRTMPLLVLVQQGFAVFLPNPRGSVGRGRNFTLAVVGDMGGRDAEDVLTGVKHLVDEGLADGDRLFITGISYGGYMSALLAARESIFRAAVPVSPVTNHLSEQLLSNIPRFVEMFVEDSYLSADSKYFSRSPVFCIRNNKTAVMNVCGKLDRCTPPAEALQFHSALLEKGARSILVTYPLEGHGIRQIPAAIDFAARLLCWLGEHS